MSHTFKICLLFFIVLAGLSLAEAQTPQKAETGSIAGQIKIGDTGAAGITVALISADERVYPRAAIAETNPSSASSGRAVTDSEGRYLINNVAAGRFRVTVLAPGYVIPNNSASVQVGEGQAISNIDFSLVKGGVVTGKVLSSGDRPVIGEPVMLTPIDTNGRPTRSPLPGAMNFRTDDRGIYRIYGVPSI